MNIQCPACGKTHDVALSDWCHHCGFQLHNGRDENRAREKTGQRYLTWLRSLLTFLPYLRKRPKVAELAYPKDREEGVIYLPYPDYCSEFRAFENCFDEYGEGEMPPYLETLEKKGVRFPISLQTIRKIDIVGLLALFVWSFRGERFCSGFKEANVEDGTYVMLLERLKEILENLGLEKEIYTFPHRRFGIGAIIGDIVGSPYEFDQGNKSEDFPLFCDKSYVTDDTIMTLAVAEGLVLSSGQTDEKVKQAVIDRMCHWGKAYPHAGYGARFAHWFDKPVAYNSFGNGAAMRVSSVGWMFSNIDDVLKYAKLTAEVSHNHPEGIKGAQATAAAIFHTRNGMDKATLKSFIEQTFGYDLSRTIEEIRPTYRHVETCQETVPEALTAYLEGNSFEDVLRKAVSLGGDCDTLTAIAASIAEAAFPIPIEIRQEALKRLDGKMRYAVRQLEIFFNS